MVQNLNCSCCFITGNIKVTCAKVFWLQITYRDCTISQTSKGLLQFHSQTENIWTFFSYTSKCSLWQAPRCSARYVRLDSTSSGYPSKRTYKMWWRTTPWMPYEIPLSWDPSASAHHHTSPELHYHWRRLDSWISELAALHEVNIS